MSKNIKAGDRNELTADHKISIGAVSFTTGVNPGKEAVADFNVAYGELCDKHFNGHSQTAPVIEVDGVILEGQPQK